jgi:hypothetical protein
VVNDLGSVYLQELMECVTSELPSRPLRFRLPRPDDALDFYSPAGSFIDIYREMKQRRVLSTLTVQKEIHSHTDKQLLEIMNPQIPHSVQPTPQATPRRKLKLEQPRLSQTIGPSREGKRREGSSSTYQEYLREHPGYALRNVRFNSVTLGRYTPERSQLLGRKMDCHFRYNMSGEDRKALCVPGRSGRESNSSSIDRYMEHKEQASGSLLQATFSQLSRQKIAEVSIRLQQERIA